MNKRFLWCFELSHSDGSAPFHYFEANSLDSFPFIEGSIVDVFF